MILGRKSEIYFKLEDRGGFSSNHITAPDVTDTDRTMPFQFGNLSIISYTSKHISRKIFLKKYKLQEAEWET